MEYESIEIYGIEYDSVKEKISYVYIAVQDENGKTEFVKEKRSSLEKILESLEDKTTSKKPRAIGTKEIAMQGLDYINKDSKTIEDYVQKTNDDVTIEVPYIAHNVLGAYDPASDKVYIVEGLDPYIKEWVKAHEYAHRRRAYAGEVQDEMLVDAEATAMTGYDPINRWN